MAGNCLTIYIRYVKIYRYLFPGGEYLVSTPRVGSRRNNTP
jgi:hypothetical protein